MGFLDGPEQDPPLLAALAYRLTDPLLIRVGRSPGDVPRPVRTEEEAEEVRIKNLLSEGPLRLELTTSNDAWQQSSRLVGRAGTGRRGENQATARRYAALRHLAEQTVRLQGGRPAAKAGTSGLGVLRIVDGDALVAWHLAESWAGWDPVSGPQRLLWPPVLRHGRGPIDGLLGRPMAENHLHLGGALPPSLFWIYALSGLLPFHMIFPPALTELEASRIWAERIFCAAGWLNQILLRRYFAFRPTNTNGGIPADTRLSPSDRDPHALSRLREHLLCLVPPNVPADNTDVWPVDRSTLEGSTILATLAAERRVIIDVLADHRSGEGTEELTALFEYLAVKNAFHYVLLHGEGHRGLSRFNETLSRRSFYFLPAVGRSSNRRRILDRLEQRRMSQVLETYLWDACGEIPQHLSSFSPRLDLEIRVSMLRGAAFLGSLVAWCLAIRETLMHWGRRSDPASPTADIPVRVGLVIHFHKNKDDPHCRIARWQAEGLLALLRDQPLLRPLIVGIDAAGNELHATPRSFASIYGLVRNELALPISTQGPFPIRLGFTYHAGEDFRDLLSGIRHVDEAAHLLRMEEGDRIGHGLALGWPAETFYSHSGRPAPRRGDHVLDLLWAWCLLRDQDQDKDRLLADRVANRLEQELAFLRHDGRVPEWKSVALRLNPDGKGIAGKHDDVLREDEVLDFLEVKQDAREDSQPLDRGDQTWQDLVSTMQRIVRGRVIAKHLYIEVNPSSNRLVGGFERYRDLPYLRLSHTDHLLAA